MTIARLLPRFRRATRAMEVLRDREQWSRADILALQLDRLNTLWQHAAAHVPYYAKLAEEQRLPRQFASLEEFFRRMPLLAKSKIKENPKAFLSDRAGHGHWKYTGGSTGTPTTAYWSHDAHRESLAAKYRFQASWGIDIFDRTTFLWGRGAAIVPGLRGRWNRFRQPYIDRLRNRQRLAAYDMSRAALRRDLKEIGDFAPRMMYGYSRALYLLAMEAQQPDSGGFHAPSLKLVVATSEPAWPNMIDTMQRAFGAPVAREYGAAECGIMATDAPDRTLRVREDHVLIETLPRGRALRHRRDRAHQPLIPAHSLCDRRHHRCAIEQPGAGIRDSQQRRRAQQRPAAQQDGGSSALGARRGRRRDHGRLCVAAIQLSSARRRLGDDQR